MTGFASFDWHHAAGLVLAILLGAMIGLERQLHRHPTGLHTNSLVALGAAAYVMAGTLIGDPTGPARVAGQVVTGVGFLCAGLIWHQRGTVVGINAAATIWCSCAVGVLAGFGLLLWATIVASLVLLANAVFHAVERRIGG